MARNLIEFAMNVSSNSRGGEQVLLLFDARAETSSPSDKVFLDENNANATLGEDLDGYRVPVPVEVGLDSRMSNVESSCSVFLAFRL